MLDRVDYRYEMASVEYWCDAFYNTALSDEFYGDGGTHNFACRRLRNHEGEHWCPGQQDVEQMMLYLKQTFGLTIPEEGITA